MREKIAQILKKSGLSDADVIVSERENFGHYSTAIAMRLAKTEHKNPIELAEEFTRRIRERAPAHFFEKVEVAPPGFINFWINRKVLESEFQKIYKAKNVYGKSSIGKNKKVIVEYSQPNIAKPLHVGHLRTTVLGDALANMHELAGYKVVRWNYLGDWGTQFGKVIAAYKLWGNREALRKNPIRALGELYARFHGEMKARPELEEQGREEFKKLETGDKENKKLWEWFKKESVKKLNALYAILDIKFDVWIGESFFEKELRPLVAELLKKNIAKRSEGSVIVSFGNDVLPPALIQKSDGASLYLTRDIANLRYRLKKYKPHKILYVVGNEQSLHFEQLFSVARLLHMTGSELAHVKYGLVLAEGGKKFASREGRAVFLEDMLRKSITLAEKIVSEKNPALSAREKERVAHAVGVGALKYVNLKENRHSDIVFDWERMLDFSGDSSPYLQYTYARLQGILRKAGNVRSLGAPVFESSLELQIVRKLLEFPEVIKEGVLGYAVNGLTAYLYELAVLANKFYEITPIIKDENRARRASRLALVGMVSVVLKKGLGLLGIKVVPQI